MRDKESEVLCTYESDLSYMEFGATILICDLACTISQMKCKLV